eukprot:scaffold339179_cov53-Prasinocladus_malaysianus.AAC.2
MKCRISPVPINALCLRSIANDISSRLETVLDASELPGQKGVYSAYDFHYGQAAVLRSLLDPETYYATPFGDWELIRPAGLWPVASSMGETRWILRVLPSWQALILNAEFGPKGYMEVHGEIFPDLAVYIGK